MLTSHQEKKNGEGKGGKYLEKKIFCGGEEKRSRKRRKIFGEEKYSICVGEEEQNRKRRKFFGEGKLMVTPINQHSAICLFE